MTVSNPFATRFTRPGAIGYLFPSGESAAALVQRLEQQQWQGQIVGPHGSGKSTLLAALDPALAAAGRDVVRVTLRDGQRALPTIDRSELTASSQLVIDGFEQLSWWSRQRLRLLVRRTGAGLLITTHADAGLPTLSRMQPTLELAEQVVGQLVSKGDPRIEPADIRAAFAATSGDIRETLFQLFDVYQARSR
jgi:energy-coupling factor transporter ATP-binding protein EcfA2